MEPREELLGGMLPPRAYARIGGVTAGESGRVAGTPVGGGVEGAGADVAPPGVDVTPPTKLFPILNFVIVSGGKSEGLVARQ